ncbi:tripartite tricarboxylate transporter substrate binding protein BugD [Ramlibacter sp. USB13]|uniref:Tripartite tricarboxylate transporter substrate binding protein BugD n=1 Tax=Ramlibacter cellulosilyticus TaxID=2764187 RepID=A0A923SGD5_9BURK|nr:tripartite tricarboxylate transporter substrate-binding protein [Ramlibacter cellulosilyticus]MBC5784827.1 tripartite tricarboxylate transporter substrate binding protein BugD [Ramlibacter cellulosilyticus]
MKSLFKKAALALSLATLAAAAGAQDFPAGKPITAVVPFAAGGPTDKVAREIAQIMGKQLNTTIVVDNSGGAGGTIGARKVVQARNDGYTILIHHIGMATAPSLYRNLGFDPLKDLEMVGEIADVPMVLLGSKALPAKNFKELLPYIKANAKSISLANAGVGSASHLCGLLFQSAIQQELVTVPYKGTAPALTDLMGGQVNLMCDQTTNVAGQVKSGAIQSYAAMQSKRIEAFKDIPTAAEQGLPGIEVKIWHAMYAPKGTPKAVVDKLSAALQAAVADPGFRAKMAELGAEAVPPARAKPESLRAHVDAEIRKWSPVIKAAGVYAD